MQHEISQSEGEKCSPVDLARGVTNEAVECARCGERVVLGRCTRSVQHHRITIEPQLERVLQRFVGGSPVEQAHSEAVSAEHMVGDVPYRPTFTHRRPTPVVGTDREKRAFVAGVCASEGNKWLHASDGSRVRAVIIKV